MATTLSTNKNLNIIGISDTGWGVGTNANVSTLDQLLGSPLAIAAAGGTTNLTVAQLQRAALRFTGALGSNAIYNVPTGVSALIVVINATTGAFTLSIGHQSGGTTVAVPQGTSMLVYASSSASVGGAIQATTQVGTGTSNTQILYNSGGSIVGSGTLTYDLTGSGLVAYRDAAAANTPLNPLTVRRTTSGTPVAGIGGGYGMQVQTTSGGAVGSGSIRWTWATGTGGTSENFDVTIRTMAGGADTEVFKITSAGDVQATTVSGGWVATLAEAQAGADNTVISTPGRVKDFVDTRIRVAVSSNLTITSGGSQSFAHGLGVTATVAQLRLVCTTAEAGFSVGDVIFPSVNATTDTSTGSSDRQNALNIGGATTVSIRYSDMTNCFAYANKGTGAYVTLTNANWRCQLIAIAYP